MVDNPYTNLPARQFWRNAVTNDHILSTTTLWSKGFDLSKQDKIISAGSCFAQHLSRRLMKSGYNFVDAELAPSSLPVECHHKYGYSVYSARYGNIYTSRQMLQLAREAIGIDEGIGYSWEKNGAYYDPLRPNVEPMGLDSNEEVSFHRKIHLDKVKSLLQCCDVFVFTAGLTESWVCNRSGKSLPIAPGVIAGTYDPELYSFKNLSHSEIKKDMIELMELIHELQGSSKCRFLYTVSPVPLTATATNSHVLAATMYSKSTLRSVVGELSDEFSYVDYFPSYEIISSYWSRGFFYETNLRNVSSVGVDNVMRVFFQQHAPNTERVSSGQFDSVSGHSSDDDDDGLVCEEVLLESFSNEK